MAWSQTSEPDTLGEICKIDPKQCGEIDMKRAAARPLNPEIYTSTPNPIPVGWIGVGGRNAFGFDAPLNADFGVELMGGAWVAQDHVQPLLHAGWSHERRADTVADAVRFGPSVGFGDGFWKRRIWFGGVVEASYVHAWVRRDNVATTQEVWGGAFGLSALFELRLARYLLVGVQAGPEIDFPTITYPNDETGLAWGPFRFNAGLRLGVIFPR